MDSRRQILLTVKEQARLLPQQPAGQQQQQQQQQQGDDAASSAGTYVWTPQQWWECFQFLFVHACSQAADSPVHDDLLFFVPRPGSGLGGGQPLLVRRKAAALPDELQLSGRDFGGVDWPASVLLNLVLQSQYQLAVVACGREALGFVSEGRTWPSAGVVAVTKPVYGCTSVTPVNLDSSRPSNATPLSCYPDICFAVDGFGDAFEDMVLDDLDRCYCVVLHALLDQAEQQQQSPAPAPAPEPYPLIQPHASGRSSSASGDGGGGSWQIGTRRRTLFAGYVSHRQVLDFMDSNARGGGGGARGLLAALLGSGGRQQDKVVMTGPGGVGRCEVAVTRLAQQTPAAAADADACSSSGGGLLQRGLQRARQAATGMQQALSDVGGGDAPPSRMLCALMLLRLPVQYLARELLEGV